MKRMMLYPVLLACLYNFNCVAVSPTPYSQSIDKAYRLKIEERKEMEIKKGNYGYLKIIFPEFRDIRVYQGRLHERWYLSLFVNNERYFFTVFLGGEEYIVPVPAGKVEIKYNLSNVYEGEGGSLPVNYQTGGGWQIFTSKEKIIKLEIKESRTVTLNIVKSSEPKVGLGCCLFVPIPAYIQDVNFEATLEVEKGEESKADELNNSKTK